MKQSNDNVSGVNDSENIPSNPFNNSHNDQQYVIKRVRKVTFLGMWVNVVVALLKGIGGVWSGSQALVADAIHSLSDLITDFAVIWGVRFWSAPADDEHPYGHGKIEALVTVFIAFALAIVAWEIGKNAVDSFRSGTCSVPNIWAFWMALVSVVAKEVLYQITHRVAKTVKSSALDANAWHHRSDALSSIPVAVAVLLAYIIPQCAWLDAVGAVLVSFFILHVAWEIAYPALQELIDAGMPDKVKDVERVAYTVPLVNHIHRVRVRRYGGAYQADLHVQVNSKLSVAQGHTIAHEVKRALITGDIDVSDASVHIEPEDVRVIISLGSNIEPRETYLQQALKALSELPCTHFICASSIIETEPVDVPQAYAKQKFLNQVAVFETALEVFDFSNRMHAIEDSLGRVRNEYHAPRTIDLDLIDFDGLILRRPDLTLPHPHAKERSFVMEPLRELGITLQV